MWKGNKSTKSLHHCHHSTFICASNLHPNPKKFGLVFIIQKCLSRNEYLGTLDYNCRAFSAYAILKANTRKLSQNIYYQSCREQCVIVYHNQLTILLVNFNTSQLPTRPFTTTSSAWSCLQRSQASSYWITRRLKIKLSSTSFSPITTNSSRNPGKMPACSTCLILYMDASCTCKCADDFAVMSTNAPFASVLKTVPLTYKRIKKLSKYV